jgi:hypothetical protein
MDPAPRTLCRFDRISVNYVILVTSEFWKYVRSKKGRLNWMDPAPRTLCRFDLISVNYVIL